MSLIYETPSSTGGSSNPNQVKVLRFLGQQLDDLGRPRNAHAYHGLFWPRAVDLGFMMWEAWIKPTSSGYLISDGYGGAHALLWGFNNGVPGAQHGNIFTGENTFSFQGRYTVALGEWVHIRVVWNGTHIYTYVNGVCDSKQAFVGPRQSNVGPENGHLYVGGSDHLNGGFDLAAIRGFDRLTAIPFNVENNFYPERTFGKWSKAEPDDDEAPCDFLCDYTQSGPNTLLDQSPRGVSHNAADATNRQFHHGRLFTTLGAASFYDITGGSPVQGPLPEWVVDNNCPFGQGYDANELPDEVIPGPAEIPSGALVFDSFGRRNQTWAFQNPPLLGNVEFPTNTPWIQGILGGAIRNNLWGILQGQAVFLGTAGEKGLAWIDIGVSDQDVIVTKDTSSLGNNEVGLCFRLVDTSNLWHVYANDVDGITVNRIVDDVSSIILSAAPSAWSKLRIRCVEDSIKLLIDDGDEGWTLVDEATDWTHQTATKAGLATAISVAGNALARYKDFSAFLGVEPFAGGELFAGDPTQTAIELMWTPSQFGVAPVTDQLQEETDPDVWVDVVGATASPTLVEGLEPDTSHTYRVRYTDSALAEVFSNEVTIQTDAPPSDFIPSDLPAGLLKSWQEADFITAVTDDPISATIDQSGNNRILSQATGANQPLFKENIINGLPVLRFDGIDDFMDGNYAPDVSQPRVVLFVLRPVLLANGNLMDSASGSRHLVQLAFNIKWIWVYHAGGGVVDGTIEVPPEFIILAVKFAGANSKAWINGNLDLASDIGAGNMTTGPRVGANIVGGSFLALDWAAQVECGDLSDSQINDVATYLAEKYGLVWSNI